MAKIIRYCVLEEDHYGKNVFKIHRPSIFGNPYTHIKNKKTKALVTVDSREEAIELYDPYFDTMMEQNEEFRKAFEELIAAYDKYDVIYLGCYCTPEQSCHGDVIIKKINQFVIKRHIDKIIGPYKLKKIFDTQPPVKGTFSVDS